MYNTNTYPTQTQTYMNYSQYRPMQQTVQQPYMGIKGRPVASIEEARASIIDFDGSIFYFPDLANRRIYTKQINMDGTALLNVYELKEIPIEPEFTPSEYITREEFEAVINQLRQASTPTQSIPHMEQTPTKTPTNVPLNF